MNNFSCFCNRSIQSNVSDLKKHIKICPNYQKESPFLREFNQVPLHQLISVHLLAIKSEFLNYIDTIDHHLQLKGSINESQKLNQFNGLSVFNPLNSQVYKKKMNQAFEGSMIQCMKCKKKLDSNMDLWKIFYVNQCSHPICKMCLGKEIQDDYVIKKGIIQCTCGVQLLDLEIEQIIGKKRKEALQMKLIQIQYNLVSCIKCLNQYSFEIGSNDGVNLKDPLTQKPLSKILIDHYGQNRFICLNGACKLEQCKGCNISPYHLGMNCDQFKFKKSQKYCDSPIINQNTNSTVCDNPDCQEKIQFACKKTLNCGHLCCGFLNEPNCLPCLHENCSQQKGNEYCVICHVEGLRQAPCIMTACNHMYHYQCLLKKLNLRWTGPRIIFNFCLCAFCKSWMQFQPGTQLQIIIEQFQILFEDVKQKGLLRLQYEGKDKDARLQNPQDSYYKQPLEYSIAIYCYYLCFQCQKPYFGGAKDCQRAMEDDMNQFDPKELVCGNCCDPGQLNRCQVHGKEFIEYKCKFCCSVALWFCWGNTHFCDSCHTRQCNNDYVSKIPKDKLPKCPGKDNCPLKVSHKPNGEECSLGCQLCRRQVIKQF